MDISTRLRRLAGGALTTALAMVALLAAATAAQAEIELSEHMVIHDEQVTAHGTVPHEIEELAAEEERTITHVAVAECNLDDAVTEADMGKRCNAATASPGLIDLSDYTNPAIGVTIEVWEEFDDFDFTIPAPANTHSECAGTVGDEDCAVVVSFYDWSAGPPNPPIFIGAEAEEITFEAP